MNVWMFDTNGWKGEAETINCGTQTRTVRQCWKCGGGGAEIFWGNLFRRVWLQQNCRETEENKKIAWAGNRRQGLGKKVLMEGDKRKAGEKGADNDTDKQNAKQGKERPNKEW